MCSTLNFLEKRSTCLQKGHIISVIILNVLDILTSRDIMTLCVDVSYNEANVTCQITTLNRLVSELLVCVNIALRSFLNNHSNIAAEGSPKWGLCPTLFE